FLRRGNSLSSQSALRILHSPGIIVEGKQESISLEASESVRVTAIVQEKSCHWRSRNKLLSYLPWCAGCAGQLELLHHVQVSMVGRDGGSFACSRRCIGRSSAGWANARD